VLKPKRIDNSCSVKSLWCIPDLLRWLSIP
jgi:hypothetical protein